MVGEEQPVQMPESMHSAGSSTATAVGNAARKIVFFVCGCGLLFSACVVAIGLSMDPEDREAPAQDQLAFAADDSGAQTLDQDSLSSAVEPTTTSMEPTTTTAQSTTTTEETTTTLESTTTTELTTTTAESTTTTEATTSTTRSTTTISDSEVSRIAFVMLTRLEFPLIDAALAFDPDLEHSLIELAQSVCGIARNVDTADDMSLALLLIWSDLPLEARLLFGDEAVEFVRFTGMALAAECPEQADRIYGS